MLVIYLSLILIFAFVLFMMFNYLRKNLYMMGSGQQQVVSIIIFVIIANLIIMTGILVYNNYHYNYQMIGDIGMQGEEGPSGDDGPARCPSKNNTSKSKTRTKNNSNDQC